MPILYIVFKTKVTPELTLQKMKMDAYIAATVPTAFAFAVDDGEPMCALYPFEEAIVQAAQAIGSGEVDWLVAGHNIAFHQAVWRKLGWPEPAQWGCSMAAYKNAFPKAPASLAKVAETLSLPPRIKVDEMTCTPEELRPAAIRDVCLVRAIAQRIGGQPESAIV